RWARPTLLRPQRCRPAEPRLAPAGFATILGRHVPTVPPMRLRGLLIDLLLLLPFGRGTERYRRRKRRRFAARHGLVAPPPAPVGSLRLATSAAPEVSILIACYGNLPRVTACLQSIAA